MTSTFASSASNVAFSPDGNYVATAEHDYKVRIWDVRKRTQPVLTSTLRAHSAIVEDVAWSPDGKRLASGGWDNTAIVWDMGDIYNPVVQVTLRKHRDRVRTLAFSQDGRVLVTIGGDHNAIVWSLDGDRSPSRLGGLDQAPGLVALSTVSPLVVTGSERQLRLWSLQSSGELERVGELPTPDLVRALALNADTTLLAACSPGRLLIWDVRDYLSPTLLADVEDDTEGSDCADIAFHPTEPVLVAVGGSVRLWDLATGGQPVLRGVLKGAHAVASSQVAFSPDGRTMVTVGLHEGTFVWDTADPRQPVRIAVTGDNHAVSARFSPNGSLLVTGRSDGAADLWNVRDPANVSWLATLTGHTDRVEGLAFNPDGSLLATAGWDGTALLWDVRDPTRPRQQARLGTGSELADDWDVAIDSTGTVAVTAGTEQPGDVWSLAALAASVGSEVDLACSLVDRGFDPDEWRALVPDVSYQPTCAD